MYDIVAVGLSGFVRIEGEDVDSGIVRDARVGRLGTYVCSSRGEAFKGDGRVYELRAEGPLSSSDL